VSDEDIRALLEEKLVDTPEVYRLEKLQVSFDNRSVPSATVAIEVQGEGVKEQRAEGNGSVDAIYNAIDALTGEQVELADYSIKSVSQGKDALGEVSVVLMQNGVSAQGRGLSTDILEASARAYIDALNRLIERRKSPRRRDRMSLI